MPLWPNETKLRLLLVADQKVNSEAGISGFQRISFSAKAVQTSGIYDPRRSNCFYYKLMLIGLWLINRGYKKEMDLANQQRNFLLSITHELKSPIASIQLVLETFQKRQLSPENIQQLTHNALSETTRLNTLWSIIFYYPQNWKMLISLTGRL